MNAVFRTARPDDLDAVVALAQHLDSLNLPADRGELSLLIERSRASCAEGDEDYKDGQYLFVLEDTDSGRIVGTSMIIASHGTVGDPHHSLRLETHEHYSETLGRLFRHETIQFVHSYTPHTEIGALVLDPAYRNHPNKLGRPLSFVRFLFIARWPQHFRDRVQAELLPPFEPDGTSRLWEWFGRPFTGLSYQEADKLSRQNKEFLRSLFPREPIHLDLCPADVRAVIGAVGPGAKGVAHMLEGIGFKPNRHIDPFDGGPHYEARTTRIAPIRQVARGIGTRLDREDSGNLGLIARADAGPLEFRAVVGAYHSWERWLAVDDRTAAQLGVDGDVPLIAIPLHPPLSGHAH